MNDRRNNISPPEASSERRTMAERRRRDTVGFPVIEICRSQIHLMLVVERAKNKKFTVINRSITWRKESKNLATKAGEAELLAAIQLLVAEERLVNTKVRFALNSSLCITRVVTGSSDQVRSQLTDIRERSIHYLSLGAGKKVVTASLQDLDARHEYALLTVTSESTLNALKRIADKVNIQIETIEPSILGLCFASQLRLSENHTSASLLVHLDEDNVSIGICCDGKLLLEYRPSANTTWKNIDQLLLKHFKRLQRFVNTQDSFFNSSLERIWVSGDPEKVSDAVALLQKQTELSVVALTPVAKNISLEFVPPQPGEQFAAAWGIVTPERPGKELNIPNLMDHVNAQFREPIKKILLRSFIPIAATIMILLGGTLWNYHVEQELTVLRIEKTELMPLSNRAAKLRKQLIQVDEHEKELSKIIAQVPAYQWHEIIRIVSGCMPDDVWIDHFEMDGNSVVKIVGAGYDKVSILDFVRNLKQTQAFHQLALLGTGSQETNKGNTETFDIHFQLNKVLNN